MDDIRLDTLVHYICARCETPGLLGAARLNMVLWYSDVFAFAQEGKSITGALYIRRQFGPVPKSISASCSRLEASGAIIQRTVMSNGYNQVQLIAINQPDISIFSSRQISLVDSVLEKICQDDVATKMFGGSHAIIWKSAQIGEEIPMAAAAFGGNLGEVDEDDIAWAQREVDRIEQGRVAA